MWKIRIKSSALLNAIFLCLLIAILCSAFILIASYNNLLRDKLSGQQHLFGQNKSVFSYFLDNQDSKSDKTYYLDPNLNVGSQVTRKQWGLLKIQTVESFFREDTVRKSGFIVSRREGKNMALFLTDYDKVLRLSGDITIRGNIIIPKGHFEKGHIQQEPNNIVFTGSTKKSTDKLPGLIKNFKSVFQKDFNYFPPVQPGSKKLIYNSFDNPTQVLQINELSGFNNRIIKGNIAIVSRKPLYIPSNIQLEDVIIKAPEIIFESGFRGNVQAFAEDSIMVQRNVHLGYPTILAGFNDEDTLSVRVGKNSTILGAVILQGNTFRGSLKRKLTTEKGSLIIGDVYCYGSANLSGKIYGSVYADRLVANSKTSTYENTLLDIQINRDSLPSLFVNILPLESKKCCVYAVIKEL